MKSFNDRLNEYAESVMRMCDCTEEYQRIAIKAGLENFCFETIHGTVPRDLFENVRASSAELGKAISEWERAFGKKRYL